MPELPEVETVRRGIAPHLSGETIEQMVIRQSRLRWPISRKIPAAVAGQRIHEVGRRGKYLLIAAGEGHLIWHLGMSGSFRILHSSVEPEAHDHIDVRLRAGAILRFRDPRRFGSLHWTTRNPLHHRLLANLGPEPLSEDFDGDWLYGCSRRRPGAVKNFLMDAKTVVGVGNIYASEALFEAGISPLRSANRVGLVRYQSLAKAVQRVLRRAIEAGGSTLRDFTRVTGQPGYFAQELQVYGREGEACFRCGAPVCCRRIGQRSSFYCKRCQR